MPRRRIVSLLELARVTAVISLSACVLNAQPSSADISSMLKEARSVGTVNSLLVHQNDAIIAEDYWGRARRDREMIYSTGSSHLLSAILTEATGMSTKSFAERYLFQPLGITVGGWDRDPQGIYMGGNNMAFSSRDMLKIGELMMLPELDAIVVVTSEIDTAQPERGTRRDIFRFFMEDIVPLLEKNMD